MGSTRTESRDQTDASLAAHGTGILDGDCRRWPHAPTVAVATSPTGYLEVAWSTAPIRWLAQAGVPVGLATDGAAIHDNLDVWESLRLTALMQKDHEYDPTWMTRFQALHHAAHRSATAVGLGGGVGALTVGHHADLALVDMGGAHVHPLHDLAAAPIFSIALADVSHGERIRTYGS